MARLLFAIAFLFLFYNVNSQVVVDSCYSSVSSGTSFSGGTNLWGQDSDLLQWTGSSWTGGWPGANLTIPPYTGSVGCRAIFCGNSSSWTSGGEVMGFRLLTPLVAGTSYSIPITYVSHGTGSTGSFEPYIYTNSSGSMTGAFNMGTLPAVGYTWTSNTFTFTAAAGQNGHNWIIIGTKPSGTSGLISSFCCDVIQPCSVNLGPDQTICQGSSYTFDATTAGATYSWSTGATSATISPTTTGNYAVTVTVGGCTGTDNVNLTVNPVPSIDLGPDQVLCQGMSYNIDATTTGATYLWSDGSSSAILSVSASGDYWVEILVGGCSASDTIHIDVLSSIVVDLGQDTTLCDGNILVLDATISAASYLWNTLETTQTIQVNTSGTYWVEVIQGLCVGSDTIIVDFLPALIVDLGADQAICPNTTITLNAGYPGASYLWSNGEIGQSIIVGAAGDYSVTVTQNGCSGYDAVSINQLFLPEVDLGPDETLCLGQFKVLYATFGGATYLWQDGSVNDFYYSDHDEEVFVAVTNGCGTVYDTILMSFKDCSCALYIPSAFSPNSDQRNEIFIPVASCSFNDFELRIFDRWGKEVFLSFDPMMGWNGIYNGAAVEQGVYSYIFHYRFSSNNRKQVRYGYIVVLSRTE